MPVDILENAPDDVVEVSSRRMLRSNVAKSVDEYNAPADLWTFLIT